MSKLYGKVIGDRGECVRSSNREIESWVQTEYGRLTVELNERGEYRVLLHRVYQRGTLGGGTVISTGNVNTRETHPKPLYNPDKQSWLDVSFETE
jgi:hypothetical protein